MITLNSTPVAASSAHAGAGAGAAATAVAVPRTPRTQAAPVSIGGAARQAGTAATAQGGLVRASRTRSPTVTTLRGPVVGYAAATAAGSNAELAFLRDPKLSLEDKLMRLLAHLSKKADAEIQKRMEELGEQPGAAAKKAGTAANKKSGILDQFVDVAGKALGPAASALLKTPAFRTAISKMAAPVAAAAAAAFGAPALAPVLLKVAPAIVSGMVAAATSGGSSTKSGAATSTKSGAATSDAALSEKDKELKLMEIQRLQNHQSEMFRMVSQILAVNHQTRLAVIGNVR